MHATGGMWRIAAPILVLALASCATSGFQRSSFELIVEGNDESYPAFEAAAKTCGYTAFEISGRYGPEQHHRRTAL